MNRLKISTRLTVSFLAMIALMLVLGGVALVGSSAQRSALTEITQRQIPLVRTLNTITDGVNEQAIQFRNLAVFSSEKIQASAHAVIQKTRAELAKELESLPQQIRSDKGKALLQELKQHRSAFLKLGDDYQALIDKGQKDEALAMLETQLRPAQLGYQQTIRGLLEHQTKSSEIATQEAESASDNLFREVLATCALAIALAAFLAIAITRSITRPLTQAVAVADRVAGGDLSGPITVKSQDEMGLLLSALQRMQQSLVNTVTAVRSNAQGVASGSAQIAVGNSDLSSRTEEQASTATLSLTT